MLTGHWSKAAKAWRSSHGEFRPTPHTGPSSCPMTVVTPDDSEASRTRGDSRCTWVSTAPGVASRPSPGMIVVPVPTTTSTPSSVSGFPARPIALIRPARTPIETARIPSTGSSRVTLLITMSQVAVAVAARRCMPSRAVLPKPVRNSSPAFCASASTRMTRPVSASSIRSPAVGPVMTRPSS